MIRSATKDDAQAIVDIYNHYVLDTPVSFEEEAVSAAQMAERIANVQALDLPWLVLEEDGKLLGYAYATAWRVRSAYRFSVETTVYLAQDQTRRGLGSRLYEALFPKLKARGLHSAIAGITLPNPASIALHEKFGMKQVARFEEVGLKFGQWLDVGYWQLTL